MILTVTGHRPEKLGGYVLPNPVSNAVMLKLHDSLKALNPEAVLLGMALGVDQWAARICYDLKIPFDAVIAFEGYEAKWPERSQSEYRSLMRLARKKYVLSPGPYRPSLLHFRNHWMVDACNAVLAVWNGEQDSGTYACIEYAHSVQKPVYKVDIPERIWRMARDDREFQIERRRQKEEKAQQEELDRIRRNAEFARALEPPAQLPKPKPKPVEAGLVYRRFIDVGEDEP